MHPDRGQAADRLATLLEVMDRLRDPDYGCPWNREQSFESLTSYTLEEAYEVVDAAENGDAGHLKEELGDLLFQVVFFSRIAREKGLFEFADVAEVVSEKLLRRHPHVFPDSTLASFGSVEVDSSPEAVARNWELGKNRERELKARQARHPAESGAESVLNDVPRSMPAMARAGKLQKRAASVGFDWPENGPVIAKLREEIQELEEALAAAEVNGASDRENGRAADRVAVIEELGDVLFSCVNLARHLNVEPEGALRMASGKFESRFRAVEETVRSDGAEMNRLSLSELEQYWQKVKKDRKV